MNIHLECLPCLGKNAVDAAKRSSADLTVQKEILAESFRLLATCDYQLPPPCMAGKILDIAFRHSGKNDIYEAEKRRSNMLAENLLAGIDRIPEYDAASFESRLRLALAGNILDFGIYADLDIRLAMDAVKSAFTKKLDSEAVAALQNKMESARKILYILDNCGEAVFDRVFMAPYRDKITLVVRENPAFNDVTADDLTGCGLSGMKYVVNGAKRTPGTCLAESPAELRQMFEDSDLIIAKGQGNFESLDEYDRPIACLFRVKCKVIARLLQQEFHSLQVILRNV